MLQFLQRSGFVSHSFSPSVTFGASSLVRGSLYGTPFNYTETELDLLRCLLTHSIAPPLMKAVRAVRPLSSAVTKKGKGDTKEWFF